jgi:hypothetical protein
MKKNNIKYLVKLINSCISRYCEIYENYRD